MMTKEQEKLNQLLNAIDIVMFEARMNAISIGGDYAYKAWKVMLNCAKKLDTIKLKMIEETVDKIEEMDRME